MCAISLVFTITFQKNKICLNYNKFQDFQNHMIASFCSSLFKSTRVYWSQFLSLFQTIMSLFQSIQDNLSQIWSSQVYSSQRMTIVKEKDDWTLVFHVLFRYKNNFATKNKKKYCVQYNMLSVHYEKLLLCTCAMLQTVKSSYQIWWGFCMLYSVISSQSD